MPSSTSSSEIRTSRNRSARSLAVFMGTFLLLTGTTSALWLWLPHQSMSVTAPVPQSNDYYLAVDNTNTLDHLVLFHAQHGTSRYLQAADVLLLGNSRLMFAFSQDAIKQLADVTGMRYYMLGFGHGEYDCFPQDIIRRLDLHPKLVIVNADHFFIGCRTPHSEQVVHTTRFEARKTIFEATVTHFVRHHLHQVLPHWLVVAENRWQMVVYRSRSDGTWLVPTIPPRVFPITEVAKPVPPLPPDQLELARQFQQAMEKRGTRVVLTFVPSSYGSRQHAEQLARHLNIPLISPQLPGLETCDTSHLTPSSAERFAASFIAQFTTSLNHLEASSDLSQ